MLPQGFLENGWERIISAGIWTTLGFALVWLGHFLVQRGVFGVKTLYPGDCAVRTLFGRPLRSYFEPRSLFFIAIIYDLRLVNTFRNVHNPFPLSLMTKTEAGDVKWQVTVNVHSFVDLTDDGLGAPEKAVTAAIFGLGDSANSHRSENERSKLVEQLVKSRLTDAARAVSDPGDIDLEAIKKDVNTKLLEIAGTRVDFCQLTDVATSEGQTIASAIQSVNS